MLMLMLALPLPLLLLLLLLLLLAESGAHRNSLPKSSKEDVNRSREK